MGYACRPGPPHSAVAVPGPNPSRPARTTKPVRRSAAPQFELLSGGQNKPLAGAALYGRPRASRATVVLIPVR
jgi:hypothetical protein